jgi:hypothetical protein
VQFQFSTLLVRDRKDFLGFSFFFFLFSFSSVTKSDENRHEWHWDRQGLDDYLDQDIADEVASRYYLDYQVGGVW